MPGNRSIWVSSKAATKLSEPMDGLLDFWSTAGVPVLARLPVEAER